MQSYPKIDTVFDRDPETDYSTLLMGQYACTEFEYLKQNQWICTEKVDGTNIRVQWRPDEGVAFKGRKEKSEIPPYLFRSLEDIFISERKHAILDVFGDKPACLYGEGAGHKIQKNGDRYYEDGQTFILFDVWIDGWWLAWEDVVDIADKLSIHYAPYVGTTNLEYMWNQVANQAMVSAFGEFLPEGIVARPEQQLFFKNGDPIRTKIKHSDFEENA